MKRFTQIIILSIAAAMCLAQDLSEVDAVRLAKDYSRHFDHDPSGKGSAKLSRFGQLGGHDDPFWDVSFDDASVMLDAQGLLRRFGWGGKYDPTMLPPGDPFAEDGAAWEFAEEVLAPLSAPEGLYRDRIKRTSESDRRAATTTLYFHVRPFGYRSTSGNFASVVVRNRDRKVISASIGRGWRYEPPSIQISESEAVDIAADHTKWETDRWYIGLAYATSNRPEAPEEIRSLNRERTFRLCYSVRAAYGEVTIDSVTGEVVSVAQPGFEVKAPPRTGSRTITKDKVVPAEPSKIFQLPKYKPAPKVAPAPAPKPRPTRSNAPNLPLVGGVSAGVAGLLYVIFRSRRN